jgi:hypothetical protein
MSYTGTCRERQTLLDAYAAATSDLSREGRALAVAATSYEAEIFQRMWDHCETARQRCADLRHQLAAHMQEHGCQLGMFGSAPAHV